MKNHIKKVLMCKPLYFDSLDYVINPWMKPGKIDKKKALKQWKNLVSVYQKFGATVEIINQKKGSPDMVFSADQGIVQGKTVLLSRFWTDERRKESDYYEQWFKKHDYTIKYLPENTYFEGNGDAFFWDDKLFIGVGYRADKKTCEAVGQLLDREAIPIEIIDPLFYHLDVGFLPIDKETAFYYPPAFSEKSKNLLKKLIPNLLEFSKKEAFGFCANSEVSGNTVIHQAGNPSFQKKLATLGYDSLEVDVSEFMKSGGGIHCLTNILSIQF